MTRTFALLLCVIFTLQSCQNEKANKAIEETNTNSSTFSISSPKVDHQLRKVAKASIAPKIDGDIKDPIWEDAPWYSLDQNWIGTALTSKDFKGRYKLAWSPEALYLIAEIEDDILYDQEKDPLKRWWDDDCLEIFVDADNSGGEHQFNHNAFAYHVALDGNVVDLAPGNVPTLYNGHVQSELTTVGKMTLWECKISIYDDTYIDGQVNDQKVLAAGDKIGFALAYCDNDASKERENFIGSVPVPGEDKNRGWIDANIFGTLELIE